MADTSEQPNEPVQQQYDNNLRGALFTNDKGGVERRPDYRGTCEIEGIEYKIAGWKRKTRSNGRPFLSLSFTPDIQDPAAQQVLDDDAKPADDPF